MDKINSYNGNCKRQLTKHGCLQANAKDDANVTNSKLNALNCKVANEFANKGSLTLFTTK